MPVLQNPRRILPMKLWLQAWRMLMRDARAGELNLLFAAVVIAVSAVSAVGFLVDRVRAGLERDAAQLLGGDLVVRSDRPSEATWQAMAQSLGLAVARTATFPSMALGASGGPDAEAPASQLVGIKAVSEGYPLRGRLQVAEDATAAAQLAEGIPTPGTVWVDPMVLTPLRVKVGETVRLGDGVFRIERLLMLEPDRGAAFVNFAPRVLMREDDLPKTGLIQPGSRVTYRLLVAGEPDPVARYAQSLAATLPPGVRLETLASDGQQGARPEMQQTLGRAQSFLSLVAMLAVLLAAVAIALAARRYVTRHIDAVAVMRCLGARSREVLSLHAIGFAALGLAGGLLGACIGFAMHLVLLHGLADLLNVGLPPPRWAPAVQSVVAGLVLLLGFAFAPLLQLRHVQPVRVFRRDLGVPSLSVGWAALMGSVAFAAVLLHVAGEVTLGLVTLAGFGVGAALFGAVTWLVLRGLDAWRKRSVGLSAPWRFALAGMVRRPWASVIQVVSMATGLMALLVLTLTQTDLVAGWRASAPADAPDRFVINIQPDQREAVLAMLQAGGVVAPEVSPMVRGRLVAINDVPIQIERFEGRARRLVDREFNLSYQDTVPTHNRIRAGAWFAPEAQEVSVEEGLFNDLHLALGDRLRFAVADAEVQARISSVRKVEWNSMKVNFFVLFPSRQLSAYTQSYLTSFRQPAQGDLSRALVVRFPNLTVVDTGAVARQVQRVLDQVIAAVDYLFVFTLAAGVLVLVAALAATRDERQRESALLRALGASRRQLMAAQHLEFVLLGGLAGLLAAVGAGGIAWTIARVAFEFTLVPSIWVLLAGVLAGLAMGWAGGAYALRGVLMRPPAQSLREG